VAEKAEDPRDVSPVRLGHLETKTEAKGSDKKPPAKKKGDEPEPQVVNPFQIIQRGEDTVDAEDQVTFADFSPNVRPADAPDPVEALPKGESAPAPAPSSESSEKTVQQTSDTSAPTPASKDDGKPSPSESSKQTSSSDQKTG
jgi:hypothetical protein